jgi:hypothetical protein
MNTIYFCEGYCHDMSNGRKILSVPVVNLSAPRIQGSCGECHFPLWLVAP